MRSPSAPRQRGIAAIELALIILLGAGLLPLVLVFGNVFWQYSVLQKSVHASTRYLASLPETEMADPARVVQATDLARAMIIEATSAAGLRPALTSGSVVILCDGDGCLGGVAPSTVRIRTKMVVKMSWFFQLTADWLPYRPSTSLVADVSMRYGS